MVNKKILAKDFETITCGAPQQLAMQWRKGNSRAMKIRDHRLE
jgi:hypothetical protein